MMAPLPLVVRLLGPILAVSFWAPGEAASQIDDLLKKAHQAEETRISIIADAVRASISVFSADGRGGGSGVVISADGHALTNYHVVKPCGTYMHCSMPNGDLYDAVLVGLDPVGDVALIKLIGRDDFPAARIGDSDSLSMGDFCFAVGNPFLLATDFQPSVSWGIVSGLHRYQYPAGTLLEYADCIQTDAAINPGNSGGPLFDGQGNLVGINGRGSFEKRGRVNVGVGYAISINQIKLFIDQLASGRIVDHATLGATVSTDRQGRVIVDSILRSSDAFRRGLRSEDQIVSLAGRSIETVNEFKNVLGIFPKGWRIPLVYWRGGQEFKVTVRLQGLHSTEKLLELMATDSIEAAPKQVPLRDHSNSGQIPQHILELIEPRHGFANYYFNRIKVESIWGRFARNHDLSAWQPRWRLTGHIENDTPFTLLIANDGAGIQFGERTSAFDLRSDTASAWPDASTADEFQAALAALFLWRRMLILGPQQFGDVSSLGDLPFGPSMERLDVLVGVYDVAETHFFFDKTTSALRGLEMTTGPSEDPVVVTFEEYQITGLPSDITIAAQGTTWTLHVDEFQMTPEKR